MGVRAIRSVVSIIITLDALLERPASRNQRVEPTPAPTQKEERNVAGAPFV